jgi:lipid-binding SYLF domain-containing protein
MRTLLTFAAAVLVVGAAVAPAAWSQDAPLSAEAKQAERQVRLQLAEQGLQKLYRLQPDAQAAVQKAAGYAVFEVDSIYAVLFVGQKGKGVLFDNSTKQPTFMNSTRVGTGPGVGKQKVYQIFVFKAKGAMEQFIAVGGNGGDLGASVSAGTDGVVRSFNPSIDIYQVPESGMAVQASWGGTVYTVDGALQ